MARPHSPLEASPSPPPQPLTKRDVRRNRIMERLQTMIDSFAGNQHHHYRAQLQAVQVDMTLVLRADPYANEGPLEDGGEEIRAMVEGMMGVVGAGDETAQRDYLAMAGRRYGEFVREVNDCLERRDGGLTALHDNYHSAVAEMERLTQQKLHQAEEEHKALTNTIRSRLIASITKKRQHLLRDKEQLDIADSNALLLHPSHFSINNPGSPGGGQNRKTRHLRHRATSPGAEAGESSKRKRKAAALDEDGNGNESPAPAFRALPPPDALGGGRSPFKDAREKNIYAQYEAPAYSLERIFTDKELAMATATAQQATYRHFHQQQQQQQEQASNSNGNGTASVPSLDGELIAGIVEAAAADGDEGATAHPTTEGLGLVPVPAAGASPPPSQPAPVAQEMERTTSHQVLTRGGARANPLAALSDLATAAAGVASAPVRDNPFAPVVPSYHAVTRSEKAGAPAPPGVGQLDIDNDFEMMRRAGDPDPDDNNNNNNDNELDDAAMMMDIDGNGHGLSTTGGAAPAGKEMRRQLLDQALGLPTVTQPYRLPLLETGPAVIARGIERPSWTGFAPQAAYEQRRLRQQLANGGVAAVAGGVAGSMAAALQGRIAAAGIGGGGGGGSGSGIGGGGAGSEAMSRTTSAGGGGSEGGFVQQEGVVGAAAAAAAAAVVAGGGSTAARRGRGRLV
ncbi:hypothetical protein LTR36_005773 [Oleoguttula mirabilis]|uniref:Uncharacterized protein n=1 Tax=Oleoguttula mirabilis TaxID=1507867 RepID=A0AAV9JDX6_9PEZI|nr:hypothetical protein LTR36_005773 [Oleoguttula mirabilis]